jgi:spermidine synthase
MQPGEIAMTMKRRRRAFSDVGFYVAAVPSYYGGFMTLGWAAKDGSCRLVATAEIRRRAEASGILGTTRYWTPEVHTGAFNLPPYIAENLPGA